MAKAPLNLLGDSFAVSHFERICSADGLKRERRGRKNAGLAPGYQASIERG
jgi:hypothetical protein